LEAHFEEWTEVLTGMSKLKRRGGGALSLFFFFFAIGIAFGHSLISIGSGVLRIDGMKWEGSNKRKGNLPEQLPSFRSLFGVFG